MNRYAAFLVGIWLLLGQWVYGETIGKYLQSVSVNIKAGSGQGSGSLFVVEVEGKKTNWVLTAYHVVEGLRRVTTGISPEGQERKKVTYDDAQILQEQVQNGRVVGSITYDAKVVCVDSRYDLALLRVRKDGQLVEQGAKLYLGNEIPDVGTQILHAGSPGGAEIGGSATVTAGIVSRIGVRIKEFSDSEAGIYDQVDCAALPGSSGGLVAKADTGEIIGIITIGIRGGDSFHWMVPVRTILKWADEVKIRWVFDPSVKAPPESEIEKIPLESFVTSGSGPRLNTPTQTGNDFIRVLY